MTLNYLDFDYSEDAEGGGSFDALAATSAAASAAVLAEVAAVLAWAHAAFAGQRAPLDEGGEWDYDLQALREFSTLDSAHFDPASGALSVQPGTPGPARHSLSLSLTGSPRFCAAFRQRFDLAA